MIRYETLNKTEKIEWGPANDDKDKSLTQDSEESLTIDHAIRWSRGHLCWLLLNEKFTVIYVHSLSFIHSLSGIVRPTIIFPTRPCLSILFTEPFTYPLRKKKKSLSSDKPNLSPRYNEAFPSIASNSLPLSWINRVGELYFFNNFRVSLSIQVYNPNNTHVSVDTTYAVSTEVVDLCNYWSVHTSKLHFAKRTHAYVLAVWTRRSLNSAGVFNTSWATLTLFY